MVERIIRIARCDVCPSYDHRGAFGKVAYGPYCSRVGKDLPYTLGESPGPAHRPVANPTNEIPDWCPLDKIEGG